MSSQQTSTQNQTSAAATQINDPAAVTYLCGDCNNKVQLKHGDPVRCTNCGYRVLYKERTKRYVPNRDSRLAHSDRGQHCSV